VVRYQRQRCGELLHVDVKKQGRIPDGGGWRVLGEPAGRRNSQAYRQRHGPGQRSRHLGYDYLHIAVDDRSRIAYAEAHRDERKATAAAFIVRAIGWFAEHGVTVERVLTDNGSCYRSADFAAVLTAHRVRHLRTRPYRPQTNGKAERFNLTLKHEWAYAAVYDSNQARLDDLDRWLHTYNHHRPHMAHDGGTPMSLVNNLPAKHT
jgi:transposase InsO family protein